MNRIILLAITALIVGADGAAASGLVPAEEWTWGLDGARIFNSVVILSAAGWLAVKFGAPILKNRAATIANELEELEKARKKAEEAMKEQEARLRQIGREAEKITADAAAEGEKIKEGIIAQAEESANRIVERAAGQIEREMTNAKKRLHEETMKAAVAMAEEIIKKNISATDQSRLVKSYLENVEKVN